MSVFSKTLGAAFIAANGIAAVGSFQAANENQSNPAMTGVDVARGVVHRPVDNFDRLMLGQYGNADNPYWSQENLPLDEHIDAVLCRVIGNVVNRTEERRVDGVGHFFLHIPGFFAMVATMPGSYAGGILGAGSAAVGFELDHG